MKIVSVLVEHPIFSLDRPLSYYVEENQEIEQGVRVEVELNHHFVIGYVAKVKEDVRPLEQYEKDCGFSIKPIHRIIDKNCIINEEQDLLANYLANYTFSPLISCYQAMLPSSLKPTSGEKVGIKTLKYLTVLNEPTVVLTKKQQEIVDFLFGNQGCFLHEFPYSKAIVTTLVEKGVVEMFDQEVKRFPTPTVYEVDSSHPLTEDQEICIKTFIADSSQSFLLEGVTGSGKTEVFINLAKYYIHLGKQVLVLVPEIALTPQIIKRFQQKIDAEIAVFHSGLSNGEKYDEYRRVLEGEVSLVIGARSAIFSPLKNIGLIIMDEEHSEAYKQDSTPRYHTREVALWRASYHQAKVLFASATPCLDSKARALKGVYQPLYLPRRINECVMPRCEIVDMTVEAKYGNYSLFSRLLKEEIQKRLEKEEQVILLLNRRGYSPAVLCKSCGHAFKCPHCDVSLNYHKEEGLMKCHYCGYQEIYPTNCPTCNSKYLRNLGVGTQKVEEMLKNEFPTASILRMDSDTVKKKKGHQKILEAFENKEGNILIGTQMIAKGLDFSNVTLVGVINADVGLFNEDYRANERTFQMITQAIGRSGRGDKEGIAVIQTYNPDHFVLECAANHDYTSFFTKEMNHRKIKKYPPYWYIIEIKFKGKDFDQVVDVAENCKRFLRSYELDQVEILGPTVPFLAKFEGNSQMCLLIKYKNRESLDLILKKWMILMEEYRNVTMMIDVDPMGGL